MQLEEQICLLDGNNQKFYRELSHTIPKDPKKNESHEAKNIRLTRRKLIQLLDSESLFRL